MQDDTLQEELQRDQAAAARRLRSAAEPVAFSERPAGEFTTVHDAILLQAENSDVSGVEIAAATSAQTAETETPREQILGMDEKDNFQKQEEELEMKMEHELKTTDVLEKPEPSLQQSLVSEWLEPVVTGPASPVDSVEGGGCPLDSPSPDSGIHDFTDSCASPVSVESSQDWHQVGTMVVTHY